MTKSALAVGVHEAKSRLSELLRAVAAGQEIDILRRGVPVARLVPYETSTAPTFGSDAGMFVVPEDFDEPLPKHIEDAFYQ